jgi:hypothetical protein
MRCSRMATGDESSARRARARPSHQQHRCDGLLGLFDKRPMYFSRSRLRELSEHRNVNRMYTSKCVMLARASIMSHDGSEKKLCNLLLTDVEKKTRY